jgi:hypothetical protein
VLLESIRGNSPFEDISSVVSGRVYSQLLLKFSLESKPHDYCIYTSGGTCSDTRGM